MNATTELTELTVAHMMHVGVLTCPLETPLRDVARLMAEHRVHCIVTGDEMTSSGVSSPTSISSAPQARATWTRRQPAAARSRRL